MRENVSPLERDPASDATVPKHPARPIAHALGNLLAVIVGQAEYLLHRERGSPPDPAEERECLEAIRAAALASRDRLQELHRLLREEPGPASPAAVAKPARARTGAPAKPAATRMRVLVVDDEPEVSQAVAALLRQVGHEVVTAPDGTTAIETARARRFDCVITDLTMPGLSGLAVSRVLKDVEPDVFVMLLTGASDMTDRREYEAAGVDRLVAKPFTRKELLGALAGARPRPALS
jgi:CheY-like chemotaxis protein